MSAPAHPKAMTPSTPGRTRTAPPVRPHQFPLGGRYRAYTIFDATGLVYLLLGFLVLDAVWALGSGKDTWEACLRGLGSPIALVFHLIAFASVLFVGVRFFSLFPKAQPPRIGPAKPPPEPLLHGGLYAVWIGVTLVLSAILAGGIF